jgi:two-component system cell cycle response regulator CtrA
VLLVDDDREAAAGIALFLKAAGAHVDIAGDAAEAFDYLDHYDYEAVVLDVLLPGIQGYDILARMRARGIATPVLMLSGLIQPDARIKGLGLGADDFVSKPADHRELLARLQAVVRRSAGYSQAVLRAGSVTLDPAGRTVAVSGRPVALTGKEFGALELLLLRRGRVVRKEVFLDHLYDGLSDPGVRVIDVYICTLRRKLAQAGARDLIGTVTGQGYIVRARAGQPADSRLATAPAAA